MSRVPHAPDPPLNTPHSPAGTGALRAVVLDRFLSRKCLDLRDGVESEGASTWLGNRFEVKFVREDLGENGLWGLGARTVGCAERDVDVLG